MPTKRTPEQLKALKPPELRTAAREWGVNVAGKKTPDIVREIMSKQNGGKTAASASSQTKVPGRPGAIAARPVQRPGAPLAARPAITGRPAAPAVARPALPSGAKPAPGPVPTGTRPVSPDAEAKFKKLIETEFAKLSGKIVKDVALLQTSLSTLRTEFDELKSLAQTVMPDGEEAVAEEESGEPAEEVELSQEDIEAMDFEGLKEIAAQLEIAVSGRTTEKSLRTQILNALHASDAVVEEEVAEDREQIVDTSWIVKDADALIKDGGEWKQGFITEVNPKTGKITAFIPDPENPAEGWSLEPKADEIQPLPVEEEVAGTEEVSDEVGEDVSEESGEEYTEAGEDVPSEDAA